MAASVVSGFCARRRFGASASWRAEARPRGSPSAPPEITDAKRKQRENATLLEVRTSRRSAGERARVCRQGEDGVGRAEEATRARDATPIRRSREEARRTAREPGEGAPGRGGVPPNAAEEGPGAGGEAMSSVKKEVNEARARRTGRRRVARSTASEASSARSAIGWRRRWRRSGERSRRRRTRRRRPSRRTSGCSGASRAPRGARRRSARRPRSGSNRHGAAQGSGETLAAQRRPRAGEDGEAAQGAGQGPRRGRDQEPGARRRGEEGGVG